MLKIKYVEKKYRKGNSDINLEVFDFGKIYSVVENLTNDELSQEQVGHILTKISEEMLRVNKEVVTTDEVNEVVEKVLIKENMDRLAKKYILYSYEKNKIRADKSRLMRQIKEITFADSQESDIKRENGNIDGNTAMGLMLQYGSSTAKEFSKNYLLNPEHSYLHETGSFHIHDLDFFSSGTTTCSQLDLGKLFKGFSTGHGFIREPQSIMSYASLVAVAIQANQNDQHGGQGIPALDFFLSPGVLKSYRKIFLDNIIKYMTFNDLEFDGEAIKKEASKINTISEKEKELKIEILKELGLEDAILIYEKIQGLTLKQLDKETFQAMESLVHNLNTLHSRAGAQVPFSSINFGTDTSDEGRMVSKNLLLAQEKGLGNGETPIFPNLVFKLKKGVNFFKDDPNYDLKRLAIRVTSKRLFPTFAFLDAPFNLSVYKEGQPHTEVAYMGCRTRVVSDILGEDTVFGRGNTSFSSINLPRLGIKHRKAGLDKDMLDKFFRELDEMMDKTKEQLLDRFEYQCRKKAKNFPFVIGQGVWNKGEKLRPNSEIRGVIKHGSISIGFVGLAETLIALTGKHHGECEEAQNLGIKIVEFMRKKTDEYTQRYQLNFTLLATPAESLAGRFVKLDRKLYGKIKGITDRDYYTNSFHVPVYYKTSIVKKIDIEAPYHAFTNAGHITYIELDGDISKNLDAVEQIIDYMAEKGVGYGSINHPVDRDPVCGYTGIINGTCPKCDREEGKIPFERIRRITGYLVGTVDRFNNAKKAEERDRVKHS